MTPETPVEICTECGSEIEELICPGCGAAPPTRSLHDAMEISIEQARAHIQSARDRKAVVDPDRRSA